MTIALSLLATALIVGIGVALLLQPSSHRTATRSPSAAAPTSSAPATPSSTSTPSVAATPSGTPTPSRAAVLDVTSRSTYQFASPTGNIICQMGPSDVRCDAKDKSWSPPAPAGCQQAHDDLAIQSDGKAAVVCHTDSIRQPMTSSPIPTLAYGTAVKMSDVLCISQSNGISCAQGMTGDSIFLARERYEVNTN